MIVDLPYDSQLCCMLLYALDIFSYSTSEHYTTREFPQAYRFRNLGPVSDESSGLLFGVSGLLSRHSSESVIKLRPHKVQINMYGFVSTSLDCFVSGCM